MEELRQELCLRRAAAAHPPPEDLAPKGLRPWTTVEARRRRKEGLATEISHECVGLHIMMRAMGYLPGTLWKAMSLEPWESEVSIITYFTVEYVLIIVVLL